MNNKRITLLLSIVCISSSVFAAKLDALKKASQSKFVGPGGIRKPLIGPGGIGPRWTWKSNKHEPLIGLAQHHNRTVTLPTFNKGVKAEKKEKAGKKVKADAAKHSQTVQHLKKYLKNLHPHLEEMPNKELHSKIRKAIKNKNRTFFGISTHMFAGGGFAPRHNK